MKCRAYRRPTSSFRDGWSACGTQGGTVVYQCLIQGQIHKGQHPDIPRESTLSFCCCWEWSLECILCISKNCPRRALGKVTCAFFQEENHKQTTCVSVWGPNIQSGHWKVSMTPAPMALNSWAACAMHQTAPGCTRPTINPFSTCMWWATWQTGESDSRTHLTACHTAHQHKCMPFQAKFFARWKEGSLDKINSTVSATALSCEHECSMHQVA